LNGARNCEFFKNLKLREENSQTMRAVTVAESYLMKPHWDKEKFGLKAHNQYHRAAPYAISLNCPMNVFSFLIFLNRNNYTIIFVLFH
ncbi:MAG: hypothetical protein FWE57_08400, partial [Chitinispirillia bacterium]|nr:hypothetical protein [Chitinispirillia bacterium]